MSVRCTLLIRSLVPRGSAQTRVLEPQTRVSVRSVGAGVSYESITYISRTQFDSPHPPELGGPGLAQPLLLGADELSFQDDVGLGVAPPHPGVAPPHPGPAPPLFEVVYGFGVRAGADVDVDVDVDGPQPGVLPPSCA